MEKLSHDTESTQSEDDNPKRKYQRISGYKVVDIVHFHLSGLTFPEIAAQIGCHRETVGRILHTEEAAKIKEWLMRSYADHQAKYPARYVDPQAGNLEQLIWKHTVLNPAAAKLKEMEDKGEIDCTPGQRPIKKRDTVDRGDGEYEYVPPMTYDD